MDDSLLDDFLDDGAASGSDFDGGAKPKTKGKGKPGPKAGAKKAAGPKAAKEPKAKAPPKKTTQTTLKKTVPKKRTKAESDDENESPENSALNGGNASVLSNTPPSAKKQKKAPAGPKKGKALDENMNDAVNIDGSPEAKHRAITKSDKDSTDRYQKLSQMEHILKRPDTYIGSVEPREEPMWVYNSEKERMEMRKINYNPGIYKIFDEILVNAADNKQNDKNMDTIKVTINREKGEISVWNNGRGIPIEIHKKEQIWIPEMIFGHLLTSSNYDDAEAKITGGRNGFGAKLTNIFSTSFALETCDSKSKQKYKQTWTANMSKMGKANITPQKGDDYTKVSFIPDFPRFRMNGIDDDFEALVKRRVYDMAGTVKGVKVYLNGERIPVKGFKSYMEMYMKAIKEERGDEATGDVSEIVTESDKERWEIGFAVSDGAFQQVSFVNNIATTSGGSHVNYIAKQIADKLVEVVKKKNKGGVPLKPAQIQNHLFIFVNAHIVNPAFTSQTKEQLTTKPSGFGSKFDISDEFMKKIVNKTQVLTNILAFADKKAEQVLKKTDGSRRQRMDNPKLTDANRAGSKDGWKCTLILTEGDSAKGLAMIGRSIIGPDYYGVFPLRGKVLNVRDASVAQITGNAEIQNIKNIIGLKHGTNYTLENMKTLRYGHIMIMTDQDHDGSHIKGLLINFLQVQYPSLLKLPGFLIEFITPIVKVYKGDPKKTTRQHTFFTMPEYEHWKSIHAGERGWEHKYYKGLGTSSDEDANRYFKNIDLHLKQFHAMQEGEPELVELAFSKKKADERKEWLRRYQPGTYLDHAERNISYKDFINKELILFSIADCARSIPSVVDGFKPGQRKVMFACFKRNLRKDIKVVELAGYVSGITAYQHGEASLQGTIVALAQNFVGSNNLTVLEPSGNFGSRLQGGEDAASARYIYTRLSPFARRVFHPLDDPILRYNKDDEKTIEPEVYVPVVPMLLVNGADGIGTGWSTSIPNYNPRDIVDNLRRMMRGEEPEPMHPWFKDWKGTTENLGAGKYKFTGVVEADGNKALVTELPVRMWTEDFKAKLVDVIKSEKIPSWIKDYEDYNTKADVNFVIHMENKHMEKALEEGLEKRFNLSKQISTTNLVAFDAEGRLCKYGGTDDILKAFYDVRYKAYQKRRAYMLENFNSELQKLSNQARFVQMIIDGDLVVSKKKKKDLVAELRSKGFKAFPKVADASKDGENEPVLANEETEDENTEAAANDYDYLLGMAIWSLTKERVEKLLRQVGDKEAEIDELMKKTIEDLWTQDLDDFIAEWDNSLVEEKMQAKKIRSITARASATLRTQIPSKRGGKKRKGDDSDSDFDFGTKKVKKEEKPSGFMAHIASFAPKPATTKTAAAKPKATQAKLNFGKTSREDTADGATDVKNISDDEDFDASAMQPAKTTSRTARNAAKKANYAALGDNSDEDDEEDFLDVGNMVKGIGGSKTSTGPALFSQTAGGSRPSSAGAGFKKPKEETRDKIDETDYKQLIASAKGNKTKPIDLDDDSVDEDAAPAKTAKPVTKLPPKKKPVVVDDDLSMDEEEAPPKRKAAPAKAPAKRGPKPGAKAAATEKPKALGPAAKAYAAKQAKAAKKAVDSDDEEVTEVDKMADEILDDDDEEESIVPVARDRPGRAAATKKKTYTVEFSDEEEDSDGFEDGDSD